MSKKTKDEPKSEATGTDQTLSQLRAALSAARSGERFVYVVPDPDTVAHCYDLLGSHDLLAGANVLRAPDLQVLFVGGGSLRVMTAEALSTTPLQQLGLGVRFECHPAVDQSMLLPPTSARSPETTASGAS